MKNISTYPKNKKNKRKKFLFEKNLFEQNILYLLENCFILMFCNIWVIIIKNVIGLYKTKFKKKIILIMSIAKICLFVIIR